MAWKRYTNKVQDHSGSFVGNARIILDYHADESSKPRKAGLLEVKDYTLGSSESITLNPADVSDTTLTEGSDFTASNSNYDTAESIASAVEGVSGFSANVKSHNAVWVSIHYDSDTITNLSSSNTDAWAWYTINSTNGTIMEIAKNDSGSVKYQPLYSDGHGFFSCYIDRPTYIDLNSYKPSKPTDNSRTENIYLP